MPPLLPWPPMSLFACFSWTGEMLTTTTTTTPSTIHHSILMNEPAPARSVAPLPPLAAVLVHHLQVLTGIAKGRQI